MKLPKAPDLTGFDSVFVLIAIVMVAIITWAHMTGPTKVEQPNRHLPFTDWKFMQRMMRS